MNLKITHPRDLLGKMVWSNKDKEARQVTIIELAEYIFNNPEQFQYICSFSTTDIEVDDSSTIGITQKAVVGH